MDNVDFPLSHNSQKAADDAWVVARSPQHDMDRRKRMDLGKIHALRHRDDFTRDPVVRFQSLEELDKLPFLAAGLKRINHVQYANGRLRRGRNVGCEAHRSTAWSRAELHFRRSRSALPQNSSVRVTRMAQSSKLHLPNPSCLSL